MFRSITILLFLLHIKLSLGNYTSLYFDEVESLSELPLDRLIQIKSSLAEESDALEPRVENEGMYSRKLSLTLPVALPLKRSNRRPLRRFEEHYDEKGKDTKISKIFQLAVTSLSFLAFGGYLLTLIITSIRRNTGTVGTGNVIVLSNLQNLQKYKRPKRNALIFDPTENDFETDRLYQGMLMLSQAYARYE